MLLLLLLAESSSGNLGVEMPTAATRHAGAMSFIFNGILSVT
jgi:hypothetical protein